MLVFTIVFTVICLAIIVAAGIVGKKSLSGAASGKTKENISQLGVVDEELKDLLRYKDSYASKEQFSTLVGMASNAMNELEGEKRNLVDVENKLSTAQKSVEQREIEQQDLKTSNESTEERLQELMTNFAEINDESARLEAMLAENLKTLDSIIQEVPMTPEQQAVINGLTEALENAGALLRDLLMEYQGLNERLEMLQTQHEDLEDEYTRLVEQQLGEL